MGNPLQQPALQPFKTCQHYSPFLPIVGGLDELPGVESLQEAMADLPLAMLSALLHVKVFEGTVSTGKNKYNGLRWL